LENMDQDVDKKRKKNTSGSSASPENSPHKNQKIAAPEISLPPEIYKAMLVRIKELEDKVESMSTATTSVVVKMTDMREEYNGLCEKVHQRMEDVTERADDIEVGLKRIDSKTEELDSKMTRVITEVDTKLNTHLTQVFERLNAAEAASNDIKLTMESMQKAYNEMKSGDKMTGQTRSGSGIYLVGIDKLRTLYKTSKTEDPMEVLKRLLWESQCYYF